MRRQVYLLYRALRFAAMTVSTMCSKSSVQWPIVCDSVACPHIRHDKPYKETHCLNKVIADLVNLYFHPWQAAPQKAPPLRALQGAGIFGSGDE